MGDRIVLVKGARKSRIAATFFNFGLVVIKFCMPPNMACIYREFLAIFKV